MRATGYSLDAYGAMLTSEPRMSAYAQALRQAITPGARVIDLGAGPGIFALLACRYGAGHVTAIDPDPAIEIARRLATANGFADRIEVVRDLSTNWTPSALADVVVSDLRGVLPLFEQHIAAIRDVRARLLKPGGVLIPAADHIHAALVTAPERYNGIRRPWRENDFGLDLSGGYTPVANAWSRTCLPPEALMTAPLPVATLDYRTIDDPSLRADLAFTADRAGVAHGLLVWFETELAPGIGFSNAPGEPEQPYGQAFFPLEEPVTLAQGAHARVALSARLVSGDYVWSWSFAATDAAGTMHSFRQSSFRATILSPETLAVRAAHFRPPQRRQQEIDAACLARFDGSHTLAEIAAWLTNAFPGDFPDTAKALDHVAALSARYNPYGGGTNHSASDRQE